MWNCIVTSSNMTTDCVFCKTLDVYYICCHHSGCKLCVNCYKSQFVGTKYGFAPSNPQLNWHNCPQCRREIIEMTWINEYGKLQYMWSGLQYIRNMDWFYRGTAGLKYTH